MATTLLVRGSNPVWSFVDLTGHQFDDTFYMWVLGNDIPYLPETVWADISGSVPWNEPIQFLANGTLPIDIFWDLNVVYRLEFRQHIDPLTTPTQSDPLIYLVENYSPGGSGSSPVDSAAVLTDNQITNPQFAEISFSSPYTLTGSDLTVQVAPGWFLTLAGTGTVVFERLALNSALSNPTNAPYALHLTLTGWTPGGVKLKQRFQQAGMLWSSTPGHTRYVASSVTARVEGDPVSILGRLVDSMGTVLTEVLASNQINNSFNEYKGFGEMPATTNTNTPPAAYIDYELLLPATADIYLTSFQLIQSEIATRFTYDEDSVDRQLDHTWHYYRDSVILKPKNSILSGWNFSLNPWQTNTAALTTAATQTQYIADQTIIHQLAASTVKTGKTGIRNNLQVKALNGVTNNRFALIQYIDPATVLPYWSYILSALARARIFTTHGTSVGIKMRLIWRTSLPSTISATEPIASWAATDPIFAAGWTAIAPLNDPVYTLPNAYSALESGNAFPAFSFNSFLMPDWNASFPTTMTLGVLIYTTGNIDSSLGSEDSIEFDRISLVPNEFALDSPPQTFDDVLRECQFYYENTAAYGASTFATQTAIALPSSATAACYASSFGLEFQQIKRATPTMSYSSEFGGTPANFSAALYYANAANAAVTTGPSDIPVSNWAQAPGTSGVIFQAFGGSTTVAPIALASGTASATSFFASGIVGFFYVADARLGR